LNSETEFINITKDTTFAELTQETGVKYYGYKVGEKVEFPLSSVVFENVILGRSDLFITCERIADEVKSEKIARYRSILIPQNLRKK